MPIAKSVLSLLKAVQRGEALDEEQRVQLDQYLNRADATKLARGRPPHPALIRFRKRFAAIVDFETLRAGGVAQGEAENRVMEWHAISRRTLWSYRDWVSARFPGLREGIAGSRDRNERASVDPSTVTPFWRVTEYMHASFSVAVAESGRSAAIAHIVDTDPVRFQQGVKHFFDDGWAYALRSLQEAFTPLPTLPQEQLTAGAEAILCLAFDQYLATAIKSIFSE
jgi:hypothetical protein